MNPYTDLISALGEGETAAMMRLNVFVSLFLLFSTSLWLCGSVATKVINYDSDIDR